MAGSGNESTSQSTTDATVERAYSSRLTVGR